MRDLFQFGRNLCVKCRGDMETRLIKEGMTYTCPHCGCHQHYIIKSDTFCVTHLGKAPPPPEPVVPPHWSARKLDL